MPPLIDIYIYFMPSGGQWRWEVRYNSRLVWTGRASTQYEAEVIANEQAQRLLVDRKKVRLETRR